jgi:hypothetical protein
MPQKRLQELDEVVRAENGYDVTETQSGTTKQAQQSCDRMRSCQFNETFGIFHRYQSTQDREFVPL